MEIILDRNSPIPIGIQIKEQIKMLVADGSCKEGDKLPSIHKLAALLKVNKNTIVGALKELENEGYVESYRGKGIFISNKVTERIIDDEFLKRIDRIINESKQRGIQQGEFISIISTRFVCTQLTRGIKALLVTGVSQELVDVNLRKLRDNISEIKFTGLFIKKGLSHADMEVALKDIDFIITPAVMYEHIKEYIKGNIPVIKTTASLKALEDLKSSMEKKLKVAVIGATQASAHMLAGMFISARLFKPKLVFCINDIEKWKKDLKDIDIVVACLSVQDDVEKLKLKNKEVYFFGDYIDTESLNDIQLILRRM